MDGLGYFNWYSNVRRILTDYNYEYVMEQDLPVAQCNKVLDVLKSMMYDEFKTKCITELSSYPVLRTYIQFKNTFGLESYLVLIKNHSLRSQLSKFRLSSHSLAIEKGRHAKPKIPVEKRVCVHCKQDIEDELHFVMFCSCFNAQRQTFFNKCNIKVDDNQKTIFCKIMSSEDESILIQLCIFIKKCLKIRSSYL